MYGDVPYEFGYAAVGYRVSLNAMSSMSNDGNRVKLVELVTYDLRYAECRFQLLLNPLNISLSAAAISRSIVPCTRARWIQTHSSPRERR